MMYNRLRYILHLTGITAAITAASLLTGCIKNDIPYPRIQANFLTFSVEGESQATVIDSATRVVNVTLAEDVDINAVHVTGYTLTPGASVVDAADGGGADLDTPLNLSVNTAVLLRMYQDYWWVIKATQNIERYFNVSGQIGASIIDVPARRVIVTMPESADLSRVRVSSAKLGPVGSTLTPDVSSGATVNLSAPLHITVSAFGRDEIWTVYTQVTASTVTTLRADAWTRVAWVYGQAEEGKDNGVEYRLADSDEWIRVPADWITADGGSFTARIIHLQPATEYAARAYSDAETANEVVFTTGMEVQPPNRDFEYWWLDGKVWCPWQEGGEAYWGTGNKGATTLGTSNTVPTDDTPTGTGQAAKLETRFVGIGSLGKLAAGSIYAGYFVRTDGTNGVLSMGRPFTQRPTGLQGWFKYDMHEITNTNNELTDLKGRPDTCIVWMALIDSDEPYEIRTKPSDRHLFDRNDPCVIAYGDIQYGHSIPQYTRFKVNFEYVSTQRIPNYIIIAASASKYGDYFTGGNGSIMYIDDLELLYDY